MQLGMHLRTPLVHVFALTILACSSSVPGGTPDAAVADDASADTPDGHVDPVDGGGIPSTFFGTSAGAPDAGGQYPTVPIGAIGHPGLLPWPTIQPQDGDPNHAQWAYYDAQVDKAVAHGVPMYISFGWTPRWALAPAEQETGCVQGSNICTLPPDDIANWTSFVSLLATRYAGKVRYYEIWNEANGPGFYTGTVQQLVALAQAAYGAIKAADPSAIVVAPTASGAYAKATAWLASYFQAGGAQWADACGAHAYPTYATVPFPFPEKDDDQNGSILQRLTAFRQTCDAAGLSGKPLVMSEGSWGPNAYLMNEAERVAWLARYEILQASAAPTLGLAATYWYAWGPEGTTSDGGVTGYGSVTAPDYTPAPSGIALGQIHEWLVGAAVSPCAPSTDGATYSCAVTRASDPSYRGLLLWKVATTQTSDVAIDALYTQVRRLDGTTNAAASPFTVDMTPVLLEGHAQ